ncbi:MAG: ABC transporter substrate-binding protein [Rubrivivax sp.]|uniref:ABC transporter substrate-binding protein n=1 Tax=Ottowia sp. TaxID=1898956 RepID=UPI002177B937|nr:ABC transporter substrate-binding protein [Ottowia sp.]MCC6813881.1 ABC transporter substrate-binding protein [Rubrivivax sp.]MCZ2088033.1 ABC transporter substrate-binding protein [Burkholderiales bacterium]HNI85420.1 ABC transporter substrate-binding protein [Ottowia sp.]HNO41587.1 ABC transporter substrate-binding protein [Ottowia sp.]HNR84711.1 ABC transporter substrate-binding protein [Ottowia sp.]
MRRTVLKTLLAAPAAVALPRLAFAQGKPEKSKLTIAVGGKNLFYYLPLTIAEQLGYFKDEGLQVEIPDFAGGAKALQALVGGSADVVSGAYEHTINMQAKNQPIMSFVLQGRAPQIVLAVSTRNMPGYKSIADLKGKKIGVTAPGSSTAMMASYVLAKAGLKASDVSFIGVGASSGAISAVKSGQVDAIANLDPVITMLQRDNLIKVVADTRTLKDTQSVYGGPMPAACLYTPVKFVQDNPGTTQALANAMVRALRWLQKAGPSDIVKTVPDSYLLGDRALYLAAWERVREAISPDGLMPEAGPATALRMLQTFEDSLKGKPIDLGKTYTNNFARKAAAKYA